MELGRVALGVVGKLTDFRHTNSTGLTVTFNGGRLRQADGSYLTFQGGSVTVPDNVTSEIMLDLFDNKLHALPRSLHRVAVYIATVTASSGIISKVTQPPSFAIPTSRIPKFKAALKRDNRKVRVALLGDSLTQGAGGTPRWPDLLFNSSQSAAGFNVQNVANITVDNYAVGGQTAHYGMVQMGVGAQNAVGKYANTNITYGPRYVNMYIDSLNLGNIKESDTRLLQYDLAIINFGANGGTYHLGYFENIVRELRSRGVEVIIGTSNYQSNNLTFLYSDGPILSRIAEAYGCEVADTWSYVREAQYNGKTVHADTIHMSADGHIAWASALRAVINDISQSGESFYQANQSRIVTTDAADTSGKFPNLAEVVFKPSSHNGTITGNGGSGNKTFNPALQFGGKTSTDCTTQLATGQYAWFGHANALCMDVLYEMATTFTADIYTNNGGTKVGTISSATTAPGRVALVEAFSLNTMPGGLGGNKPGYVNQAFQIVVTSGSMNLVGVVFYTWNKKEILFEEMNFIGTWAKDTGFYSPASGRYTDTDGDSVFFEFEGTGCQVLLNNRDAAGKIDVWLDGVQVQTGLDLYNTGKYYYSLNLFPLASSDIFNRGYGKHTVRIKLNGINAAAVAPAAQNRRLALFAAYAFDGR
ncbi:hypothetical protein BK138_16125 [Paenibacillus rhizosphaerae]|uniref:SGNH hydrolase-type esterase domain-containing protein n=1 Tax=Paenibacillus rhizosphaerae TaxID=297318 RepID=A0A1R1ES60_9BACL|nr:SGNH/GDSL hydrolase family protein [Paenibacillus rhizosphaerae]OMF54684.1 hypothetical protein BK138_16125 [Paenibacillus rhizosphaerae]